jgi:MFS family permease
MFIAGRAVAGLGEGLFLSVCGVWLIECAPKEVRGRMGAMLQLGVTLGVASGYFVCYGR